MRNLSKKHYFFLMLVFVCLLFSTMPINHKIHKEVSAPEFQNNNTAYGDTVNVSISGVYKQYLFKKDTFQGMIKIDKYGITSGDSSLHLTFIDHVANMHYTRLDENVPNTFDFGTIQCTPDFCEFLILFSNIDEANFESTASRPWSSEDTFFITFPAESRGDALILTRKLASKSKWLSNARWQ